MLHVFLLLAILFVILPFDAQILILGVLRSTPQEIWLGALGASLGAMFWYSLGWNGLAERLHREETSKADENLSRRRR